MSQQERCPNLCDLCGHDEDWHKRSAKRHDFKPSAPSSVSEQPQPTQGKLTNLCDKHFGSLLSLRELEDVTNPVCDPDSVPDYNPRNEVIECAVQAAQYIKSKAEQPSREQAVEGLVKALRRWERHGESCSECTECPFGLFLVSEVVSALSNYEASRGERQ